MTSGTQPDDEEVHAPAHERLREADLLAIADEPREHSHAKETSYASSAGAGPRPTVTCSSRCASTRTSIRTSAFT